MATAVVTAPVITNSPSITHECGCVTYWQQTGTYKDYPKTSPPLKCFYHRACPSHKNYAERLGLIRNVS
jgi:hypothetical protein